MRAKVAEEEGRQQWHDGEKRTVARFFAQMRGLPTAARCGSAAPSRRRRKGVQRDKETNMHHGSPTSDAHAARHAAAPPYVYGYARHAETCAVIKQAIRYSRDASLPCLIPLPPPKRATKIAVCPDGMRQRYFSSLSCYGRRTIPRNYAREAQAV